MASVIHINRLTPCLRQRILQLNASGVNQVQIVARILHEENVKISRQTVNATVKKQREIDNGSFPVPKKRGPTSRLNDDHLGYINMCLEENGELSSSELCFKLKCVFGVSVSTSTVKAARRKLGWVSSNQAYCQTVRAQNRPKRLEYALRCIQTRDKFLDVIFTDESTVKIQTSTGKVFYKIGKDKTLQPKPKHPFQVHVGSGTVRSKTSSSRDDSSGTFRSKFRTGLFAPK